MEFGFQENKDKSWKSQILKINRGDEISSCFINYYIFKSPIKKPQPISF